MAAFLCIKDRHWDNFSGHLFHEYALVRGNYNEPGRTLHESVFVEILPKKF
ncbi:hypothetical protein T11_10664 [Trichinella zimbabwensis]|uniref:Uncharacterized protein n=1 Tax=Trichinella zimbabwensis TaxID=268475 RepID=A0A0V1GJY8_9BILA|nr:hypothetical protein T11_10664 [Trichinella zimbabwensis]